MILVRFIEIKAARTAYGESSLAVLIRLQCLSCNTKVTIKLKLQNFTPPETAMCFSRETAKPRRKPLENLNLSLKRPFIY